MADDNAPPKKKPSGAQFRKARAAREAQSRRPPPSLVPANSWGAITEYSQSSQYWDPNGPPIELPIYGQPPTTLVAQVSATLMQLEQGVFYQASYLWDGMTRDDRVAATIGQRLDRLIGSPLELEPSDPDEEDEQETKPPETEGDKPTQKKDGEEKGPSANAADLAKESIFRMIPPHQQYELMRYALGLSVGIAQVLTTRTVKSSLPTFEVWNPRHLRYDWLIRKFCLVTANRGEIVLEEDDPEWIIYQPYGPRGWLHGALIRSLAQPWLIRYWMRTWWSRHQEVHGQPIRLGELPPVRTQADERQFLKELKNIGFESVIRLPVGSDGNKFDVRLLEAAANDWEGFQHLLEHCDDSIAIAILGQRQSTMGQGGLKAQDDVGESTMLRLTRKDSLVGDLLRDKILKPWADANLGDEELAPHLRWQFEDAEDEKDSANTDYLVGQALNQFKAANAPINIREYLTERGYPLLSEQEEQQLVAEKAAKDQQDAEVAHQRALEIQGARSNQMPPSRPPPSDWAATKTT